MAQPTQEELEEWFKDLDKDGSGKIDVSELRVFVKAIYELMERDADDAKIDADVAVCIYIYMYLVT